MYSISRLQPTSITPSATEIAKCFCELDDHDMAIFFNTIATVTTDWAKSFTGQLRYVANHDDLTAEGKLIMKLISNHGE